MIKNIIIVLFLIFNNSIFSQQKNITVVGYKTTTVKSKKIDPKIIYSNLYHLETEEKITKSEFSQIKQPCCCKSAA